MNGTLETCSFNGSGLQSSYWHTHTLYLTLTIKSECHQSVVLTDGSSDLYTMRLSLPLSLSVIVSRGSLATQRGCIQIPSGELDGDDGGMRDGESDVLCLPRVTEWFITQTDACMSAWGSWSALPFPAPSVAPSLAQHYPIVCCHVEIEKKSLVHVAPVRLLFLFVRMTPWWPMMILFTSCFNISCPFSDLRISSWTSHESR